MSKIKIETLTPVHIGSGNLLQNNADFVIERKGKDSYIHIIDERKILELIGQEHIDDWLLNIENKEPTSALVKRFAPNSKVSDYSKQRITCYADNIKANDTLKEVIHNGLGLPYIPGSSLKGAIRTAVLSSLSGSVEDKEDQIFKRNRGGEILTNRNGIRQVYADIIERELFGNDPNSDIFRFIRIGDAYFDSDSLIATKMVNLNIRKSDDLYDDSKPQLVEAIGAEIHSFFDMHIASEYYNFVSNRFQSLGTMPNDIQSLETLFMLINEHTRHLVEDEIEYWKDVNITKSGGEDYIEEMQNILSAINACDIGKSCVLRVGHASGWRFITGGWAEKLNNFESDIIPASRPNNNRYDEYDFPKSRRVDEDSYILGFVKLSIE